MENYKGIKFKLLQNSSFFSFPPELRDLAKNGYIHSLLGLTPMHSMGAAGNFSMRDNENEFIISKSCYTPSKEFLIDDFTKIHSYLPQKNKFVYSGASKPSSESALHMEIYNNYPTVNAIFHGHCELFDEFINNLPIPVTLKEYPYGSIELARSCVDTMEESGCFLIYLKNHGYVSSGKTIEEASLSVLKHLKIILDKLTK